MPSSLEKLIGQSLGSPQTLGWFGFAADPPTLAHRAAVDAALGSGRVEKLVVFPAGKLSYKSFTASDWQRIEMTEMWAEKAQFGDEVILSRFDIMRDTAITWIDLWRLITERAPKIEHWLIVGSDQYLEIPQSWDEGELLMDQARIMVIPREGSDVSVQHPGHLLLDIPALPGSSTAVREGNRDGVDEAVKAYILEQHLYS